MELETVNKLYLELSQFTTATTCRELHLEAENDKLRKERQRLYEAIDCALNYDYGSVEIMRARMRAALTPKEQGNG